MDRTTNYIIYGVGVVVGLLIFLGLYFYNKHRGQVLLARMQVIQPLERQRRVAALSRMYTKAATSPPGSLARATWEDFMLARSRVEGIESRVQPGSQYRDGWSGTPQAWGFDAGFIARVRSDYSACNWRQVEDFSPLPCVAENGFSLERVQQGHIGDSYLVAALASTPMVSDLLDGAIVTTGVTDAGVYCVRFFVHGHWEHVFVDSLFPSVPGYYRNGDGAIFQEKGTASKFVDISPSAGRYALPSGASSTNPSELWPALLEKAFAKLHGSYASIAAGGANLNPRALELGSGVPLSFFTPDALPGFSALLTPALESALWWKLEEVWRRGWAMTMTSKGGGSGLGGIVSSNHGIQRNHAFTVLRVQQVQVHPHHHKGGDGVGMVRLVQLRNPLARGEWTGAYSDKDAASWTPEVRQQTGWSPEASGDDGVFWMPFGEVVAHFEQVSITPILLPPECHPGVGGGAAAAAAIFATSGWYRERVMVEWVGGDSPAPQQYSPAFTGVVLLEITPTTHDQWLLIRRPVASDYPPFVGTRGAADAPATPASSSAAPLTPVPQADTQLSFFPELIHVAMEVGQGPYFVDPLSLGLIEFASQAPFTVRIVGGWGAPSESNANTSIFHGGGTMAGRVLQLPVYPGPPTPHPALMELHQMQQQPQSYQSLSFLSLPPSSLPPHASSSFSPLSSSSSSSSPPWQPSATASMLSSQPPAGPPPPHSFINPPPSGPATTPVKPLIPIRPAHTHARSPFTQGDSSIVTKVNPLMVGSSV